MIIFVFDSAFFTGESFRMNIILVSVVYELTFKVVMAAAFKTSGCFGHSLLFGKSERNDFAEVALSFICGKLRNLRSAHSFSVFKCLLGNIISFNYERFFIFEHFAVQISVDAV